MDDQNKKTSCINVRLHSSIKNEFVSSARKMGMTLTEYLEDILINKAKYEDGEVEQAATGNQLKTFTEAPKALKLFEVMKGQKIVHFSNGKKYASKIEKIEDVYSILLDDYHSRVLTK